jgi:LCP family protein required for cell wall assembly
MRDIYLAIPGVDSTRLNHAYAYGGADLLIDTIEQNFKVRIDRYVQVNFFSFITVVDAVGGVEIEVSDAEVKVMNSYLEEINTLEGDSKNDSKLSGGGTYTLNGKQALAYARIRYVGNADFDRTKRQRDILNKVIAKTKKCSFSELNDLLNSLLPQVTTNLQEGEIYTLMLNSASYLNYDRVQARVPVDGSWSYMTIRGMSVLGLDFQENIDYLFEQIYE